MKVRMIMDSDEKECGQDDAADDMEFICMYCRLSKPRYMPFINHLAPENQYGFEDPYGGWVWVEEVEEEGYWCESCSTHLNTEEVMWIDKAENTKWFEDFYGEG